MGCKVYHRSIQCIWFSSAQCQDGNREGIGQSKVDLFEFNQLLFQPASYCFVEFVTEDDARNAMLKANGRTVPNDPDRHRFNLSFANSPEP